MKKSILVFLLVLSLVLNVGCKSKEEKEPSTKDETTTKDEAPTEDDTPAEVETTTTGKIYAPSPEGIRPDNATKSSSKEGSGFVLTSAPSQTKVRTPRNR